MRSFYSPGVGDLEIQNVRDVIERGVLSTGEIVKMFETEFSNMCEREHAVAVTSGSVALELALKISPLSSGDRIIVSPFNCTSVLYAIRRCELDPVFVDIDPITFNLDPDSVEKALETNQEINALLLTPTYGLPEDVEKIIRIAERFNLRIINDFCQAPGAYVNNRPIGAYGDIGICSFGATKPITTGEGGIVVTDESSDADSVRSLCSNSGVDSRELPTNVKLSDIEASIGMGQLSKYNELVGRRRAVATGYKEALPTVVEPQSIPSDLTHVYHRFAIRAPDRDKLQSYLHQNGIETSNGIDKPLYELKCIDREKEFDCPHAEALLNNYLLLPMHPKMNPEDAREISETIMSFYE
jgi:dTDP-4-amino-4,6-dideoxygalactose transaminase